MVLTFKSGDMLLGVDADANTIVKVGNVYKCIRCWEGTEGLHFVAIEEDSCLLASRFILATELAKALV